MSAFSLTCSQVDEVKLCLFPGKAESALVLNISGFILTQMEFPWLCSCMFLFLSGNFWMKESPKKKIIEYDFWGGLNKGWVLH